MKITFFARGILMTAALLGGLTVKSQVHRQGVCQRPVSDTIDILHYDIHLKVVNLTAKQIKGYTTLSFTPGINNVNHLRLQLLNMHVDSVCMGVVKIKKFRYAAGELIIPLLKPAFKGDTLEATVYYQGQPYVDPSEWGGFHFSGQYAFNLGIGFQTVPHNLGRAWFPCIDDFTDRATYDVYGCVENDKKAICGGILVSVTDNDDHTRTWHWKLAQTIPAYLASITVGDYRLVSDTFPGMKARVPITYYVLPSEVSKVAGTFTHMKDILATFESHFGPYPFDRVGFTATATGAMEHATNISFPSSGISGNLTGEWWYAHELSHMWFGDLVTCASAADMWMNEGWAVWCESLYREGIYDHAAYQDNMRKKLREVLRQTHIADAGYRALYGIPAEYTYGSTVYAKGGIVVHTLRNYMGDSLFFGGVKAYLRKYAYNHASTCDLRDFLSAYSGINLNDFFDTWVFRPGFPHFSIDSVKVFPVRNSYRATVFVRQKLKGATTYARSNRMEITFMGAQWQLYTDTLSFSGELGMKTFTIPFQPVATMLDLHEKIADATTDIAKVITAEGEYDFPETYSKIKAEQVPDSAFVRITHNWVAPDSLKTPVAGLRLSDNRYWTVEGLFPPGFKAKGQFYFDNILRVSPGDSIWMLYRNGPADDWRPVPIVKHGNYSTGYVMVDSLRCGEYALAVYDTATTGLNARQGSKPVIKVVTVPGSGLFSISLDFKGSGYMKIINAGGVIVDSIPISAEKRNLRWSPPEPGKGTYIFQLWSKDNRILGTAKVRSLMP